MLSVMRMNKIFPVDHKNQTITAQPGALLIDIQAAAKEEGLFYPPDPGEKQLLSVEMSLPTQVE